MITRELECPPLSGVADSSVKPRLITVRHLDDPNCPLRVEYLNSQSLHLLGVVNGSASAGRGNTTFFQIGDFSLVLRHYYRGGLVRKISKQHYLYTGLNNSRAFREFDLLVHLQKASLPAPIPYACGVRRQGFLYCASLITHRLPGSTLASRLQSMGKLSHDSARDNVLWQLVGQVIAQFHRAGIYHADLNAHNILIHEGDKSDDNAVCLIDFDRGRIRSLPANPQSTGWCVDNMRRLERSCHKVVRQSLNTGVDNAYLNDHFPSCRSSWASGLAS